MKKLLALLTAALMIGSAAAKETVTIYYAWSAGDTIANYGRTLAEEANKIQDKYTFIFDTKPGAGNAIAANFVKANSNTILFTSSAFFIRPNFYPNESYNIADFRGLMPFCYGPMAVSSFKYKSWAEVPKDKPLNIGVSGLGVTSHLISLQIIEKYPNMQAVPFKSVNEAMLGMISGNLDFTVGFIGEAEQWAKEGNKQKLNVLGITGTQTVNGFKPLASLGFNPVLKQSNVPHHLVVPASISADKFAEWRAILTKAQTAQSVQDSYKVDSCRYTTLKDSELDTWFTQQTEHWKKLGAGVKLN
jgi:tripartite-type tricarboxylate transporter receptor subunit TctC